MKTDISLLLDLASRGYGLNPRTRISLTLASLSFNLQGGFLVSARVVSLLKDK